MFFVNKFMSFCKIIGFTKQIYENKSLSPNHIFTFKIPKFFFDSLSAASRVWISKLIAVTRKLQRKNE